MMTLPFDCSIASARGSSTLEIATRAAAAAECRIRFFIEAPLRRVLRRTRRSSNHNACRDDRPATGKSHSICHHVPLIAYRPLDRGGCVRSHPCLPCSRATRSIESSYISDSHRTRVSFGQRQPGLLSAPQRTVSPEWWLLVRYVKSVIPYLEPKAFCPQSRPTSDRERRARWRHRKSLTSPIRRDDWTQYAGQLVNRRCPAREALMDHKRA